MGRNITADNDNDLKAIEEKIANSGSYSLRATHDEIAQLDQNPAKRDELFKELIIARLREWVALAAEVTELSDVRIFITGGNDDAFYVEPIIESAKSITACEGKVVCIGDSEKYEMISSGYGNVTPWKCPRDISEEELGSKLEGMASMLKDTQSSIFNLHVPPVNSEIDDCVRLDTSTYPPTPMLKDGSPVMYGGGSTSVRAALETHQPLVGLHGHIHESRGIKRIGRTMCFNPGSEYAEGILRGVIINLADRKVKSYQFTSG